MSITARAAKTVTWTFDPNVSPDNDIIRERVLLQDGGIFTGSAVTVSKAYGFVPVMAAIRLRSETIASLPLGVFERIPRGKQSAPDHRVYGLLHDQANPEMSSFVWREVMQSHLESWGNCYSEIEYDTDGFPLYLWPLRADMMENYREDGALTYYYTLPDGTRVKLPRHRVFHIPGLGYDGRVGYSPIHMARQAIALGQAAEEMAGRFYQNDARPGIAIKLGPEYDYDDDAKKRLAESFDATHAGLQNKHRTAVLDEGMDIEQFGFPAEDAQLVEQQRWSVEQVCRIFNIPPHMLHSLERATFNNIEELGLNFVTYSLRPWLVRWEQQIKMQLLAGDTTHFAEFNVEGLLRGKIADRMDAYWKRFQMGSLSANEIREKENDNPIDDGDNYYVPANIIEVQEEEPAPQEGQLPPLQLVGTRSTKALASADQRRALAEEFRPLFEKVTASVVEFEAKSVLAEAERRFASTETAKAFADAIANQAPPQVKLTLPDSFQVDAMPITVNVPEQPAPEVTVDTTAFAKALNDLRDEIRAPRTRKIIRDENNVITGVFEESA